MILSYLLSWIEPLVLSKSPFLREYFPSLLFPPEKYFTTEKLPSLSVSTLYIVLVALSLQCHILFFCLVSLFLKRFYISNYKLHFTLIYINFSILSLINIFLLKNIFRSRVFLPSFLFSI